MLHAELMVQMDKFSDKSHELEAVILRTEEERDTLQVCVLNGACMSDV